MVQFESIELDLLYVIAKPCGDILYKHAFLCKAVVSLTNLQPLFKICIWSQEIQQIEII